MSSGQAPSSKSPPSKAAAAAAAVSPSPPPSKKAKGAIDQYFIDERTEEERKCQFVLNQAPLRKEHLGIVSLRGKEEAARTALAKAMTDRDFVVARGQKEKLQEIRHDLGLEERLVAYSRRLYDRSADRIEHFSRQLDIDQVEIWTNVRDACKAYLAKVPEEDVRAMSLGKMHVVSALYLRRCVQFRCLSFF